MAYTPFAKFVLNFMFLEIQLTMALYFEFYFLKLQVNTSPIDFYN